MAFLYRRTCADTHAVCTKTRKEAPKITAKRGERIADAPKGERETPTTPVAIISNNMKTLSPNFIAAANARRAKRSAQAQVREKKAVQMHEAGHSYQEIADTFAVSRQFAHVLVQRAYARTAKRGESSSDIHRH